MTVQELIAILEGMNPSAEVRIALQPNYPLLANLEGVTDTQTLKDAMAEDEDFDEDFDEDDNLEAAEVYLCAGRSQDYGSRNYWNHLITE